MKYCFVMDNAKIGLQQLLRTVHNVLGVYFYCNSQF